MAMDAERRYNESVQKCKELEELADELYALAVVPRQFFNTAAYERYVSTISKYKDLKQSQ